jgi:folylpolyglutamate synthase/dihydrofolate synthase
MPMKTSGMYEGIEWLNSLGSLGMKLGLENISELLSKLGNPQNSLRSIHTAGSDGKGSTCAMIFASLRAAGISAGLYTSPHIVSVNERISVNSSNISDEDLNAILNDIRVAAEEMKAEGNECTFFEVITAAAFLHFSQKKVEYAVLETGLGGRFDATNIVIPEVSVITHISLEHTSILGNTIEEIAFEKAGIIKNGVPVITANTGAAFEVIKRISEERGSELILADVSKIKNVNVTDTGTSMEYSGNEYVIGIPGRCQAENAIVAIETLKKIGIREEHIKKGLSEVRWPGRMEHIGHIIVDVTHTGSGALALSEDIKKLYGKVVLIIGMLNDKKIVEISKNLISIASAIVVTQPDSERAFPATELKKIMEGLCEDMNIKIDIHIADNIAKAMETAEKIRNGERILVTGSLFMAGDLKKWLRRI